MSDRWNFSLYRFDPLGYSFISGFEEGLRQNGAPSGLENRGLDASIYHKTRKPTEGT
ncbi:hypothetical protein [Leptospira mayottensis]|uniref:Uncharacterized protein n=1 Tax=Leptospira mayottensis 200901122 TaxID=1193010 RepID=A0AA87SXW6_9LEPT|nr:hypothetical protein [Leptospira mayottensis]EKS00666.1 hypothetical protein LEP1GSC125_1350 [Leptospira mayottensis 200901122]